MLLIGFCINSSKPKCAMGVYNKGSTTDSQYCVLHDLSYRFYGNPDYNAVFYASCPQMIHAVLRNDAVFFLRQ